LGGPGGGWSRPNQGGLWRIVPVKSCRVMKWPSKSRLVVEKKKGGKIENKGTRKEGPWGSCLSKSIRMVKQGQEKGLWGDRGGGRVFRKRALLHNRKANEVSTGVAGEGEGGKDMGPGNTAKPGGSKGLTGKRKKKTSASIKGKEPWGGPIRGKEWTVKYHEKRAGGMAGG